MKQFLLLCVLALAGFGTATAQQNIYVDANRDVTGGTTDGTSFATAYNSLQQAIMEADSGATIFLADGVYRTDANGPFFIDKGLTIAGGYDGTDGADPDPAANRSILSGDVLGNDTGTLADLGDSTMTLDNSRVMIIDDTSSVGSSFTVFLDGITIADGRAPRDSEIDTLVIPEPGFADFAGGGLWTTAQVQLLDVTFIDNQSPEGGGSNMYMNGANTNGSILNGITMERSVPSAGRYFYMSFNDGVIIANSTFSLGDLDDTGSAIFRLFITTNTDFQNCTFSDLNADVSGSAIATQDAQNVFVRGCSFTDINSAFGAVYVNIDNDALGGRPSNEIEFFVIDSDFTRCTVNRPGGALGRGGALRIDGTSHLIRRTTFDECGTTGGAPAIGGAIYYQLGELVTNTVLANYDSCTFTNNVAGGNGGAIFTFPDGILETNIRNSMFSGNVSSESGGGAIYYQSLFGVTTLNEGDLNIINTTFDDNGSDVDQYRGSAILMSVQDSIVDALDTLAMNIANMSVDSCTFTNNTTTQQDGIVSGGTIFFSGPEFSQPTARISNSVFSGNNQTSTANGGAFFAIDGYVLDVDNCDFINNTANTGGVFYNRNFGIPLDTITGSTDIYYAPSTPSFDRCLFLGNQAGNQGGVINTFDIGVDVQNSIFANNLLADGAGSGGAVILNGPDDGFQQPVSTFVNNTFYGNADGGREEQTEDGPPSRGNAIAVFQVGTANPDSVNITVQLQNNAFFQLGEDQEAIGVELNLDANDELGFGDINIISLGGNYFNTDLDPNAVLLYDDMSGDTISLEGPEIEDIFVDAGGDVEDVPNFELVFDADNPGINPLINNGTTGPLVPSYDFFDNPRGARPDIGAIEFDQASVSTKPQPADESGLQMAFFPNPTADFLNVVNNESTSVDVIVTDMNGRVLGARTLRGTANQIDLTQLPAGIYNLQLTVNDNVYVKQVVKQ